MTGGIILGMMPNMSFETETIILEPGDRVVMFTDGITEAMDPAEEEFGEERVQELVSSQPDVSAQSILESIVAEVETFSSGAPQADDITMVIVKALSCQV